MNKIFIFIGFLVLINAVQYDIRGNVVWKDRELGNPIKDFEKDQKNGRLSFKTVQGYSTDIVSYNWSDYKKCYMGLIDVLLIDDTGDYIKSDEQRIFKEKAKSYAKNYNLKLLAYLKNHNIGNCKNGETWNKARRELNNIFKNHRLGHKYSQLGEGVNSYYLTIHKLDNFKQLLNLFCPVFLENNIKQDIKFEINVVGKPNYKPFFYTLKCTP